MYTRSVILTPIMVLLASMGGACDDDPGAPSVTTHMVSNPAHDTPCFKATGDHKAFDRNAVKDPNGPDLPQCDGFGKICFPSEHITGIGFVPRSGGDQEEFSGVGPLTFEYGPDASHAKLCEELIYLTDLIPLFRTRDDTTPNAKSHQYHHIQFADCERLVSMLVLWGGQRHDRLDAIILTTRNLGTGVCKTYRLVDRHAWIKDWNGDGMIDEVDIDLARHEDASRSRYTRLGDIDSEIIGWRIRHGLKDVPRSVDYIEVETRKLSAGDCTDTSTKAPTKEQ